MFDKIIMTEIKMDYFEQVQEALEQASPEIAAKLSEVSPIPPASKLGGGSMYSGKPGASSSRLKEKSGGQRDDVTDGGSPDGDGDSENMSPGLRAAGPIHGDIIQEEDDDIDRTGPIHKTASRKADGERSQMHSKMSKQPPSALREAPSQRGLGGGGLDNAAGTTQPPVGGSEMGMGSSNASPSLKSLMTSKQGKQNNSQAPAEMQEAIKDSQRQQQAKKNANNTKSIKNLIKLGHMNR